MTTEPEAIPADVLDLARAASWEGTLPKEVCAYEIAHAIMADRASRAPVDGAGWRPIETADKDASSLMLGIFRQGVLEEIHIGGYRYALNDDEVSCWWSDQGDDEICPTHWLPLPGSSAPGTHPAPASPDAEMVRVLVDSLRHSFITSQSDGSEDEYRLVAQFKTLLELQQAYAALMDLLSKHEGLLDEAIAALEPAPKPASGERRLGQCLEALEGIADQLGDEGDAGSKKCIRELVSDIRRVAPPSPSANAQDVGKLAREATAIAATITVSNFHHHREIGDLSDWIDSTKKRILALAAYKRSTTDGQ